MRSSGICFYGRALSESFRGARRACSARLTSVCGIMSVSTFSLVQWTFRHFHFLKLMHVATTIPCCSALKVPPVTTTSLCSFPFDGDSRR